MFISGEFLISFWRIYELNFTFVIFACCPPYFCFVIPSELKHFRYQRPTPCPFPRERITRSALNTCSIPEPYWRVARAGLLLILKGRNYIYAFRAKTIYVTTRATHGPSINPTYCLDILFLIGLARRHPCNYIFRGSELHLLIRRNHPNTHW